MERQARARPGFVVGRRLLTSSRGFIKWSSVPPLFYARRNDEWGQSLVTRDWQGLEREDGHQRGVEHGWNRRPASRDSGGQIARRRAFTLRDGRTCDTSQNTVDRLLGTALSSRLNSGLQIFIPATGVTSRHALSLSLFSASYCYFLPDETEREREFRWRVIYTGCIFNKVAIRVSFFFKIRRRRKFLEDAL